MNADECRGFDDRLAGGFFCSCGERFWPDCDMSAASIVEEYENHLRDRGIDPKVLLAELSSTEGNMNADDDWIPTDDEGIDMIVDGENVLLLQKLVYKLKDERDAAHAGIIHTATSTDAAAQRACTAWWATFGGSADPVHEWDGLDEGERHWWRHVVVAVTMRSAET